jgi:hypothetical protein
MPRYLYGGSQLFCQNARFNPANLNRTGRHTINEIATVDLAIKKN